jgi:uncharacterized RDD family membrane protein YckC
MYACRNHPDVIEGVRHCSRCGGPFCRDCIVALGDRLYCATCKVEQLRDVQSGIDRTHLNYASILKRFGAMFLDGLIFNIPLMIVMIGMIISTVMKHREPPFWINFLGFPVAFLMFFYEALMLQMKNGQTLGKMALRVRVVRADGSPLTSGQAWGRAGMRVVLGFLCMGIVDYLPALFTDEKTALHDMAAGTRVVELY